MKDQYDPRPVLQLICNSLEEAINERNWSKVEDVCNQIKSELEKSF